MDATQRVFDIFGTHAYLVGGAVRDIMSDKDPKDLDFATDLTPDEVVARLESFGLPVFPIGLAFGTVGAYILSTQVEITTFRCKESYTKGSRKPQVVFGKSIEEDLVRRDFTFNAMALDCHHMLIDLFNGREDLKHCLIRTPGITQYTFRDDPLRMLRVARFISRGFTPDREVHDACKNLCHLLRDLSGERVREELTKILSGEYVVDALEFMAFTGMLVALFPSFQKVLDQRGVSQGKHHSKDIWGHIKKVVSQTPADKPLVRWAALFHDIGKPDCRDIVDGDIHFYGHDALSERIFRKEAAFLHFSADDFSHIRYLIRNHMIGVLYTRGYTDTAIRRLIREHGEHLDDMLVLTAADITSARAALVEARLADLSHLRMRVEGQREELGRLPLLPSGIGSDIMTAFNLTPGRRIGELRALLEEAIIEGKLQPRQEPETYIEYLREIVD